jgi:hypothetical protein
MSGRKMARLSPLALALMLSLIGCGTPAETETPAPPEASSEVVRARDAALTYVRAHYEHAPAESLSWVGQSVTPEGQVGGVTWQYTADGWVVTISYPVVPPEVAVYSVLVANETAGLEWKIRVNAQGDVEEGPEMVLAARDSAVAYLIEHYGTANALPALPLHVFWAGGRSTPEGLLGRETFQYTGQGWVVTIAYPVVAPEAVVCGIVIEYPSTGLRWEGQMDAEGQLTESVAPEGIAPAERMFDMASARDAALNHVYQKYQYPPGESVAWEEEDITPEGLVGSTSFRYTAFNWVVEVSYPIVAPEATIYEVTVTNADLGLDWQGTVDAEGTVTERPAPSGGQPVVCWYGRVVGLPEGAQFDDYLALEPEGAGEIGVEGADADTEAEISALRDKEEPGDHAHFWGTLTCDTLDYGGCQVLVTRLRPEGPEGPFFGPDPVEGWEGTIVGNPAGSQFDDYFVLAGDFPVGFGIDSIDPELVDQLEGLRDTQTTIRVWGEVTCPAIDSFGTHIAVSRMEVE